ncbi:hypothetical protein [Saccharicrinis fermentans]|uniref:Uncharacterized protein n=1 Tax=Saccharicrinis fermentans DSM 9555 = JCM 21142 TaxID=869213 RepID=W7YA66_9BACT|nr:hypothetical protein [Saccharicrinis fermentans]GAF04453.1 hypothetical protein JCM21142_83160 [Saccharicrinis fermentans DSM 9555 = JCM 21142]
MPVVFGNIGGLNQNLKLINSERNAQSQGDGLGTIPGNAIGPPLIDFAGNVLEGKHNAALAENLDDLLPYSIDINTGKTTWVNPKYMKNKKLTIRGGNMLIFLYNEFGTVGDLRSGAISTDQFWTNTGINGLGSISPQYGGNVSIYGSSGLF